MKPDLKKEINYILKSLKEYQPEKVILFGSAARGDFHKESDIDMLIIKKSRKRRVDRIGEVLKMCNYSIPFEPLVYTPQELKKRRELGDFFIEEILKEGKVIYEKKSK